MTNFPFIFPIIDCLLLFLIVEQFHQTKLHHRLDPSSDFWQQPKLASELDFELVNFNTGKTQLVLLDS